MFSFQPVFNLYVSHSKFVKTTTSPSYSSLPKFSPVPEDRLCSQIILPLAYQSQSTVLTNTYLDLCNRDFVFSSAPLSPIFHSKYYITDKIFCKVPFQHPNPCFTSSLPVGSRTNSKLSLSQTWLHPLSCKLSSIPYNSLATHHTFPLLRYPLAISLEQASLSHQSKFLIS